MPLTVFVTDGNERPALAIVRALGRRGLRVLVGDEGASSLASSSRYAAGHVTYPSPYTDRRAFATFLADFIARERIDVLMPVSDVTTYAVCADQERLQRCSALAVPPFAAFDLVTNKARLIQYAAAHGIKVPRTHVVANQSRLHDVIDDIAYPAVAKPVQSRLPTETGWQSGGVHYAQSRRELEQIYRDDPVLARRPSLVQQRIVGPGVGVFALFDRGAIVADFAHRRLREKPPAGGASVLSESLPVDATLREQAARLLAPLEWHGVAMLEYKHDQATGDFYLMEVNGRFWGSLQLAIDAGVDFPFLACLLATGQRPAIERPYAIGVRNRWLAGDLDHLLLRLFRSAQAPPDPLAPPKWRALVDFCRFISPGLRYEVERSDDPRPFLYEFRRALRSLSSGALRMAAQMTGAK